MNGRTYHADATAREAWQLLSSQPGAALVDVRTAAEWAFVGVPDLSAIDVAFLRIEWQSYPGMQVNPGFAAAVDEALRASKVGRDAPVLFICRSGARSAAAAAAMAEAGYARCFNISDGFEGNRDEHGHRGTLEGWKAADLPWVQS